MNNQKYRGIFKKIIVLIIVTIGVTSLGFKDAEGIVNTRNVTKQKGHVEFPINDEVVFRGVFSSHSWYFNTDKWWKVNTVDLEFNYSINQILDKNAKAYLTFSANGIPFNSQEVKYKKDTSTQTIKLKIPKNFIKPGSNEVKVESYSRISELPCVDDVNNANWLTINKNTKVVVNFNKLRADNMISNFPYPFIQVDDDYIQDNQIVIPDKYNNKELADALMLNTYLGGVNTKSKFDGLLVKYSDMDKSKNTIFVGMYDNLPKELKSAVNGGKDISKEEGIIKLIRSPYTKEDNTQVLIITSKDEGLLEKSTKLMMNTSIVQQLNMSQYKVAKEVDELDKVKKETDKVYFKELAGDKILLKGPFRRSFTVGYNLPKNKILSNGGQVALNFRYSENLDFDRSLVSVYINDVPIGSQKLSLDKANGDSVTFNIPNDIKNTNYLNVEVAFDLEIKDTWCEKRQEDTPWAYVTGDSNIYIPTVENINYYFNQYPNPFVRDYNLNDVLLVTPTDMCSNELTALGDMFSYMGKYIKSNRGSLVVESGDNVTEEKNNRNIIVYGTPSGNPFIKDINDKLWFKYNNDFTAFESNAKEYLTAPYNKEISTLQLDVSPYNKQRGMLVITAPDTGKVDHSFEMVNETIKYLSTDDISKLTGDSAIIDKYGNVTNYKMKEEVETKPAFESLKNASNLTKGLIVIFVLFVILIGVSVGLYINKYKKDNKNDSEKKILKKIFKK